MHVLGTRGGGFGGLEKHFFDLCNGLAEEYDVVAVCHPDQAHGLSERVHFESLGRWASRRNPFTLLHLAGLIRLWKPDIIHAHAGRAASMVSSVRLWTNARRIATVHSCKRKYGVYRTFDSLIAVSQGVARPIPFPQVSVVYDGVRPPATVWGRASLAHQFGFNPHRPIAVSVGRLVPEKGFDVLLDAWCGVDAQLLIIGDGPEKSRLETQISRSGLRQTVQLTGFCSDLPSLLANADLAVISSRREGFPHILVEALAARIPVVSTAVPGAEETLPEQFLVPPEDAAALRTCILSTLRDVNSARKRYESVWRQAAERFSVENMVKSTAAIYFPETRAA